MKQIDVKPIAELMNKSCGTHIDISKLPDNMVLRVSETDEIDIVERQ